MQNLAGRFLREAELRSLGIGRVGENVAIHETCVLVGLELMEFGDNVRIDPFCVIAAVGGGFKVGNFVHVGSHCSISAGSGVELGDFSGLSAGVRIFSRSDDYSGRYLTNPTVPSSFTKPKAIVPVRLGRHVIVGAGAVILPEVEAGEGAAVGAGAVVNRNLEDWGIYAGAPTRRVGSRRTDLLEHESRLKACMILKEIEMPVSTLGDRVDKKAGY